MIDRLHGKPRPSDVVAVRSGPWLHQAAWPERIAVSGGANVRLDGALSLNGNKAFNSKGPVKAPWCM